MQLIPSKSRGGPRNKNKQGKGKHTNGSSNGTEWTSLSPASLWAQIKKDALTYYGFSFGETAQDSLENCLQYYGIQKMSLLRSFCLKTGVQIFLREYQLNKVGGSGKSNSNTFTHEDILNVFPVVKHIDPKVRHSTWASISSRYFL